MTPAPESKAPGRPPRLYLLDCMGFVFRAYHALPPLTSPEGVPTGAVYGFCNMVLRLLEEHHPDYIAAVFDTQAPTFRKELYAQYKANRPPPPEDLVPQFALVDRAVDAFSITSLRCDGYEADDVIATAATSARERGWEVVVVSSDKDLMQLVGDGVTLLDTMKNGTIDAEKVEKKFGVPPEQLGDWLALCGDSVDNVPGVPGVGPKTASKLLKAHGDLEGILAAVDEVRGPKLQKNLKENSDQARLSRKLVELDRACPLPVDLDGLKVREPDEEALGALFEQLGFSRLRDRMGMPEQSGLDRGLYRTILDEQALGEVVQQIRAAGRCAVDVETTDLDPIRAELLGISLCWGEGEACYLPLGHDYLGCPRQLERERALSLLAPLLTDPKLPKFGQHIKYDWLVLHRAGLTMEGIAFDTMLASYLLDPSRSSHGLDALAADHLGHTMLGFKEVAGKGGQFAAVELPRATEYAAEDAEATFRLAELLEPRLAAEPRLEELFRQVELPLSALLARMELAGVRLDTDQLRALSRELSDKLTDLEEAVRQEAGWDVNINSPKQLQKLLFEDLGLTAGRKTKTGYSTDADTLADLAMEHPIAGQIEEYRTLAKLKNTYLDALPRLVNPRTGRVHTSFNQAVAATGRLSSSDPNLQNIPIRSELGRAIRRAFVAPEGRLLLSADYSQVELRILAHLSEDPVLLSAFREGEDVHTRTAAEVFGVPAGEVSSDQRRVAKAVNFGVIYGQSDWGLSRQLRIPRATAKQYIEAYFERYAGVKAFMERTIAEAKERGEVETLLGRRRPLPEIQSSRHNVRAYGERMARNTPIQGTAADLLKLAMLRVDRALTEAGFDAPMILTVHDEVVLEVRQEERAAVGELVQREMAGVMELSVPLQVDLGAGETWAEAHG